MSRDQSDMACCETALTTPKWHHFGASRDTCIMVYCLLQALQGVCSISFTDNPVTLVLTKVFICLKTSYSDKVSLEQFKVVISIPMTCAILWGHNLVTVVLNIGHFITDSLNIGLLSQLFLIIFKQGMLCSLKYYADYRIHLLHKIY